MLNSKEELITKARTLGYKPEILEKVYNLLDIFNKILAIPYLKERFVLKGGTALNLFHFTKLPRLSVDIDLNYIGSVEKAKMMKEKPLIVDAINKILTQNNFNRDRSPMNHAGSKMIWYYNSLLGQRSSLEIDLNFMYRQPLYPIVHLPPNIENYNHWEAPLLDIHELAAGKLTALFARTVSRDFFDSHQLMTRTPLDIKKLREAFTIYISMSKIPIPSLSKNFIQYDVRDIKNRLLPVMYQQSLSRTPQQIKTWAEMMLTELNEKLSILLPLKENEEAFILKIRNEGIISPELITDDKTLADNILQHPGIQWVIKQNE